MDVVVYSDASFCQKTGISACGFIVIQYQRVVKHVVYLVSGLKTPTRSEAWALTVGLQDAFLLESVSHIAAYTDCMAVIRSKGRHRKYPDFLDTIEMIEEYGIGFNLHHVKGHSTNKYNKMIDRSCNSQLKEYLKNNK